MTRWQRVVLAFSLGLNVSLVAFLATIAPDGPPSREPRERRGGRGGFGRGGDMVGRYLDALELQPEQRVAIEQHLATLRDEMPALMRELHGDRHRVLGALLRHPDDDEAARAAAEGEEMIRRRLTGRLHTHLRSIGRLLTPEQRERLIEQIEVNEPFPERGPGPGEGEGNGAPMGPPPPSSRPAGPHGTK